jgi:DNA-binding transcriptional ArsR family regulator
MQPFGCISAGVDEIFKALADANRRKLLDQLHTNNGQTLSELCQHLEMSRQAVTKHLTLLENANLVVTLWHGRQKLHYLNPVPLQQIIERWIDKYQRRIVLALSELECGLEKTEPRAKPA